MDNIKICSHVNYGFGVVMMCQSRCINYNYLSGAEMLIVEEVVHVLGQQLYGNLIFIQF